jgi:hypothetical protein
MSTDSKQARYELDERYAAEAAELEARHLAELAELEDLPANGNPRRLHRSYRVEVARGDGHDIPRAFTIREDTEIQVASKRASGGWAMERSAGCRDVTDPLTRNQLAALIESGASWLAYLGEGS